MNARDTRASVVAMAVAMLVGVLALPGCGGGGSSSALEQQGSTTSGSGSAGSITKPELISQADAVCAKTDLIQRRQFAKYKKDNLAPGESLAGKKQEEALRQAGLPPIAVEIREVAALGAPAGEVGTIKAIIDGWEAALRAVDRRPSLLITGLGEGPFTRPDKLAGEYGFKACGQAL